MNRKIKIPFPIIDIYLFKWRTIKNIGIHDHAKNGCMMILLNGKLEETIYNHSLYKIKKNIYSGFNISFINNKIGLHDIKPLKYSNSIHLYYPKNHNTKYFSKIK